MQENQYAPAVQDGKPGSGSTDRASENEIPEDGNPEDGAPDDVAPADGRSGIKPSGNGSHHSPRTSCEIAGDLGRITDRYLAVRRFSESLCETLEVEDFIVQSMPDVSPTRWHLAHTTWFFETFALSRFEPRYDPQEDSYRYLFNSYYNKIGEQFPRANRGLITRPTVAEVFDYRRAVDDAVMSLLSSYDGSEKQALYETIELGLHHEQQHQELMLTDIKHVLSCNPLFPAFKNQETPTSESNSNRAAANSDATLRWIKGASAIRSIGHEGDGFSFDNESPRHEVLLAPHELANRLVTCDEYREFIEDGGYRRPELWLSLGWHTVQEQQWQAPMYWHDIEGRWHAFTLGGLRELNGQEPVAHVSFFEADAFARWKGARLPLEAEWEVAAEGVEVAGNLADRGHFHPVRLGGDDSVGASELDVPQQLYGDVWEWTASPYVAYPGYRIPDGAVGEYNGKFMCNQYVLRGGSCATSRRHIRPSYRNFFPPEARWQFSGIRLARDEGL